MKKKEKTSFGKPRAASGFEGKKLSGYINSAMRVDKISLSSVIESRCVLQIHEDRAPQPPLDQLASRYISRFCFLFLPPAAGV